MKEWFMRLITRIALLLTESDTSIAEFWGSTMLVWMGAWLIVPFDPDTFASVPVYHLLGHVMPEWAWGLFSIGLGFAQSMANLTRGKTARRTTAFFCSVYFGFLSFLGLLAFPASLFIPLLGTAALVEGIVFLHLRKPMETTNRVGA